MSRVQEHQPPCNLLARKPPYRSLEWVGSWRDGHVRLLDQTKLPGEVCYLEVHTAEQMWEAIRNLRVRGAPAIGIAAAMALVLGLRSAAGQSRQRFDQGLDEQIAYLRSARPTAVNLGHALERLAAVARRCEADCCDAVLHRLWQEALTIQEEDAELCRRIGTLGSQLLPDEGSILTHCNTGALATAELGTALGIIITATLQGKRIHVYVDETRPLLQGARLTMWELQQWGIPATLLCDSAAGSLLRSGRVAAVLVGADRIAANGDTANKIGTYSLAVLAQHHGVPFYVAAPHTTFDMCTPHGDLIPVEHRPGDEVTHLAGQRLAPEGVEVYNPAFDVTPAPLIGAIITDRGIIRPVAPDTIRSTLEAPGAAERSEGRPQGLLSRS